MKTGDTEILWRKGHNCVYKNEYDRAKSLLNAALKSFNEGTDEKSLKGRIYKDLANTHHGTKEYEKAITFYIQAVDTFESIDIQESDEELITEYSNALFSKGTCLMALARYEEAHKTYSRHKEKQFPNFIRKGTYTGFINHHIDWAKSEIEKQNQSGDDNSE